jgi:hypothetical protein
MADNLAYSCGSALLSSSLSPTPLQMSVEERDGAPAGVTGRCLVVGLTVTYDALAHTAVAECELDGAYGNRTCVSEGGLGTKLHAGLRAPTSGYRLLDADKVSSGTGIPIDVLIPRGLGGAAGAKKGITGGTTLATPGAQQASIGQSW